MTGEPTPGVLLKGEDGSHYFIPKADLSGYAVDNVPPPLAAGADVAANVPRLHAFAVQRVDAAHMPTPEGGTDAAAIMPMPENASETAAFMPMPESGSSGSEQS